MRWRAWIVLTIFMLGSACTAAAPEVDASPTATSKPEVFPSPETPPAAGALQEELVLRGDGLGVASFGETEQQATAAMTAALGPPASETSDFVGCGDDDPRLVKSWRHLGLIFRAGEFVGYRHSRDEAAEQPYRTESGIGIGASLEELRQAYGTDLRSTDESIGGSYRAATDSGEILLTFSDIIAPGYEGVFMIAAGDSCFDKAP